ncbi:MAG: D-alanine--D-alanine ligase family protein [Actinomycetota bacterium]
MTGRRRVLLLMGGRSSEHEVSLSSARGVRAALDPERNDALVVLISTRGDWTLDGEPVALAPGEDGRAVLVSLAGGPPRPVDVVFPVLHGPFGEDGTVQGLCEIAGVPYVGSGVAASAVAMDKAMFKAVMRDAGLPVAEEAVVTAAEWRRDPQGVAARVAARPGFPAFCKPARLGSSVGISPVPDAASLAAALDLAFAHDAKVLVERRVRGREVEVGVLGNGVDVVASPVGEITYDADWYDYDTKYLPDRMRLVVPADVPPAVAEQARDLAVRAFVAAGCAGMARVDFFLEGDRLLVSELNTIPGFTPTSVYASLFAADGIGYAEVVNRLVDLAVAEDAERSAYRH